MITYFPRLTIFQDSGNVDDDEFEIIPQEPEDDVHMWNVEDENEDEVKRAKIQSTSSVSP